MTVTAASVLDASALLAYLGDESGADIVESALMQGSVSAIQQLLSERLSTLEVLAVDLNPSQEPEKPWMRFAGVFKDDPDFAAIARVVEIVRKSG